MGSVTVRDQSTNGTFIEGQPSKSPALPTAGGSSWAMSKCSSWWREYDVKIPTGAGVHTVQAAGTLQALPDGTLACSRNPSLAATHQAIGGCQAVIKCPGVFHASSLRTMKLSGGTAGLLLFCGDCNAKCEPIPRAADRPAAKKGLFSRLTQTILIGRKRDSARGVPPDTGALLAQVSRGSTKCRLRSCAVFRQLNPSPAHEHQSRRQSQSRPAPNNFPKLHNAMWPGLVGKGQSRGRNKSIDLDTMLDLTAKAEVNGVRFDGVDLFLYNPHVDIDLSDDSIKRLADKIRSKGFVVGSVVARRSGLTAPRWATRTKRKLGHRSPEGLPHRPKTPRPGSAPYGVVRIDSAASVTDWDKDPKGNTRLIAKTFREGGKV